MEMMGIPSDELMPVRYGFLQFRPDYTSGEVYNWGLLFLSPAYDTETNACDYTRTQVLVVYDKEASRLKFAVPNYPEDAHNAAIKAIRKVLNTLHRSQFTNEELVQKVIDALPIGFEYREGGTDYIEPRFYEKHIQMMYSRYVMRFPDHTDYPQARLP